MTSVASLRTSFCSGLKLRVSRDRRSLVILLCFSVAPPHKTASESVDSSRAVLDEARGEVGSGDDVDRAYDMTPSVEDLAEAGAYVGLKLLVGRLSVGRHVLHKETGQEFGGEVQFRVGSLTLNLDVEAPRGARR